MSMLKGLPIERSRPSDADVDAARGEASRVVGGVDERTREKAYQVWLTQTMFWFFTYADPDHARALYPYPIPIRSVPPTCHVLCIRTFCCWSASIWWFRIHIRSTTYLPGVARLL